MQGSNGSQAPSQGPDFNLELRRAQQTGDFKFVINTAKASHKMLVDLRDAIRHATFPGTDSMAIAQGLNFVDNLIANAAGQVNALKQTERATQEALKAMPKEKVTLSELDQMSMKGPETPEEPGSEAPAEPGTEPEAPSA